MRQRLVETHVREQMERERIRRIAAILAEGVHVALRRRSLLRRREPREQPREGRKSAQRR